MALRYDSRQRKLTPASYKSATSPTSSTTTSSSRQVPEASADGQSSPASYTVRGKPQYLFPDGEALDAEGSKENVTVTVRFRPLSQREIRQGEEIAWYADGDTVVRSEHNPILAYAYDRVFGPTTTTRHVYDVAAQHVVSGAMEGVNGTIFAYGVTSSGKTHTMHGDQRSPGIIPLAVKDAFSIIQETPSREFLLRVSYLEIYNEVVNDLLNPAGQNLRIREDTQGTFVEGIKEEVVLSPAHALSLIAAGEEHRHVGSNNFNLLSSRSHTIFTLTIESSPCGDCGEGGAVNFSLLNLIDLAGSESSRAETTGVRRKEGSYINKSLLTLGTVIAKLIDGKATHIPYRDSKLTRLLQSSLSGQGRVSLICTVTPSSSNAEETHNTLKFAHRAKCIEIQASQNKIIDEKSLIKKYQNEIHCLKQELDQLKRGIVTVTHKDTGEDDFFILKQKLEDGHVKLQSRLEQEEEAKAALLGRIQRLTKLILVSTKTSQSPRFLQRPGARRRHSFGEEELAYLPYRRRDMIIDNENAVFYAPMEGFGETNYDVLKEEKKNRKHGLLNWLKLRKRDSGLAASDGDKSSGTKSHTTPSTPQAESIHFPLESGLSNSLIPDSIPAYHLLEVHNDRELAADDLSSQETPMTNIKTIDHVELLKEQLKILAGEVALHSSVLKRLSDEAAKSPKNEQIQIDMRKVKEEVKVKNQQIASLEKQMANSFSVAQNRMRNSGVSPPYAELLEQLNEKSLELEVKTADNSIIQDQLQQKIHECEELQETITSLKQQLSQALEMKDLSMSVKSHYSYEGTLFQESRTKFEDDSLKDASSKLQHEEHLVSEIKELKQKVYELTEANSQLEGLNQKLAEESAYAKGLASAAGVELKALSEQVTKLMNHNQRLAAELASMRNSTQRRASSVPKNTRRESHIKRHEVTIKREVNANYERELEAALLEKEQREAETQKKLEESKQKEAFLENELANMWVLVAKLKKSQGNEPEILDS
ncbi:kinesin-like protein KIN-7D, chloroplastic isoform X1 [Zingiber officinale]|uniref:kinesin-like protein KIN-7D, chloroplastic isoform X1 n=1 Tax=Zingiber officinale TaxID=94328 RepID=UPI001C4C36DB|nr:kinesin-like protein KIN-7D, chloroplastic isoform X1 [Zingiber officinale]